MVVEPRAGVVAAALGFFAFLLVLAAFCDLATFDASADGVDAPAAAGALAVDLAVGAAADALAGAVAAAGAEVGDGACCA